MKILHYTLGLPPYRTGGLTKYSIDLMKQQIIEGHSVYCLFPGRIKLINKETKIEWYRLFQGIKTYEIINPLPVPIFTGIKNPQYFHRSVNDISFKLFLIDNKIEIVHLHTIMGLPIEFLDVCRSIGIKVVFTTHDYFGLCTRVNFINCNGEVCRNRDLEKCFHCNKNGDSYLKLIVLQSALYRFIKNKGIINKIKKLKKIKTGKLNDKLIVKRYKVSNTECDKTNSCEYKKLYNYYDKIFQSIDYFLYNSMVSQNVFSKFGHKQTGSLISITHGDIKDNRKVKKYTGSNLNVTYLGPYKKYKGFDLLMETMRELHYEKEKKIHLTTYGDIGIKHDLPNVTINSKYNYSSLEKIFNHTDVLVVPSIWEETFGFIVLEAISYGVPVIVTDTVGAKDLLVSDSTPKGIVIGSNVLELKSILCNLLKNKYLLQELNQNIVINEYSFLISDHTQDILSIYQSLVNR